MSRYLTLLREQKNSALTCEKSELCEITPVFQGGRVLNSHNSLISHTRTEKSTGREAKRFCITASMQQTIRDYTEGRLRANDATRSAAACHGSDEANRHYEYFGMAAERGFIEELERHGLNPQGYVFLAGTAREKRRLSEPDFTYCGLRFDIKACPPKQGSKPDDVSINQGKHENPNTRPDWYVLCLFTSETDYTVALLPAAEVDRWELRPGAMKPDGTRRKPYYAISRRLLPCLHDLSELTALTNADAVESDPQPFREDDTNAEEGPAEETDDLAAEGRELLEPFLAVIKVAHRNELHLPLNVNGEARDVNEYIRYTAAGIWYGQTLGSPNLAVRLENLRRLQAWYDAKVPVGEKWE